MIKVILGLLLFLILIAAFYFLWINGYMVQSKKRAVLFVGSVIGKNSCKVKFKACNGSVRRVIKLSDQRSYTFNFNHKISEGTACAEIRNKNNEVVLKLDPSNSNGVLTVPNKERYYLSLNFDHAEGEFELTWN